MLTVWNGIVGFSRIYNNTMEDQTCVQEYARVESQRNLPQSERDPILTAINWHRSALFADTVQVLTLGSLFSSTAGRAAVAAMKELKELHLQKILPEEQRDSSLLICRVRRMLFSDTFAHDCIDIYNMVHHNPRLTQRASELELPAEEQIDLKRIDKATSIAELPRIPIMWRDYPVFQKYICPITEVPIRVPIKIDGASPIYYERDAILLWLHEHGDVKPTSWPADVELTEEAFVSCIDVKLEIDHALRLLLADHQGGAQ